MHVSFCASIRSTGVDFSSRKMVPAIVPQKYFFSDLSSRGWVLSSFIILQKADFSAADISKTWQLTTLLAPQVRGKVCTFVFCVNCPFKTTPARKQLNLPHSKGNWVRYSKARLWPMFLKPRELLLPASPLPHPVYLFKCVCMCVSLWLSAVLKSKEAISS